MNIGIAGAGLLGRLCAIELTHCKCQHQITLFDCDKADGEESCGVLAAGMLAPFAELATAEPMIAAFGLQAIELWPAFLKRLVQPVSFQEAGSFVVAHIQDIDELTFFKQRIEHKLSKLRQLFDQASIYNKQSIDTTDLVKQAACLAKVYPSFQQKINPDLAIRHLNHEELQAHIPNLATQFQQALYFPMEGFIVVHELFRALTATLRQSKITWHQNTTVTQLKPYSIYTGHTQHHFDWVIDCRGIGAQTALPNLRGVRGEIVTLHAKGVSLSQPIRLLHPRYPLYIVPQPDQHFMIGASQIESEDRSPISVRTLLELLSAAYAVHPGFAEARVIKTAVHTRPAFPDHAPRILQEKGLTMINGLYRHGYLLALPLIKCLIEQNFDILTSPK